MAKKTFVQRARVVSGQRWHIEFYIVDPATGNRLRRRQDFDLHEIDDLKIRREVADRLARYIEQFTGVEVPAPKKAVDFCSLATALNNAVAIKLQSPRTNSHKGYKSVQTLFLEWCPIKKQSEPISEFTKKDAREFFDYLHARRKYRGITINNYLAYLRGLWAEMIIREVVDDNPFKAIKPVRKEEKMRRMFNPSERRIVAKYIQTRDYWLFRALLLQFFCYIRPVELTRIRGKSFDFDRGVVKIESYESKKWKTRWATIPQGIMPYFLDGKFDKTPANFHPFGLVTNGVGDQTIGPSKEQLSDRRMYKRHKKYLEDLKRQGQLSDISGLAWYSWKDTGISLHANKTSPMATRDQAGHEDFEMTLTYYTADQVNKEYSDLCNDLFD